MSDRTCEAEGCDRAAYSRGLCQRHYNRQWWASKPEGHWRTYATACEAEGCERKAKQGDTLCRLHRLVADGSAVYSAKVPPVSECSYEGAHARVKQYRGKASEYPCAICGQRQANVWAHLHRSAYPVLTAYRGRFGGRQHPMPYSPYVMDYLPACRRCHTMLDGGHNLTRAEACASPVCDRPPHAEGMCKAHYNRHAATGDARLAEPIRSRRSPSQPPQPCRVDGCAEPAYSLGYCPGHAARVRSVGDPVPELPLAGRRGRLAGLTLAETIEKRGDA